MPDDAHWQVVDHVDGRVEPKIGVTNDRANDQTTQEPADRTDGPHDQPFHHEDLHDFPSSGPHRFQDGDFLLFIEHDHDQRANDVETRDQNDETEEHGEH
jgi:hypothetical protein